MINKEIKEICLKCEHNIHCQNKGCAFRSLGNEYCDEVENANNLINDLQQRINKAIKCIDGYKDKDYSRYDENEIEMDLIDDIRKILGGKE